MPVKHLIKVLYEVKRQKICDRFASARSNVLHMNTKVIPVRERFAAAATEHTVTYEIVSAH